VVGQIEIQVQVVEGTIQPPVFLARVTVNLHVSGGTRAYIDSVR
jgi:hypothetical protein